MIKNSIKSDDLLPRINEMFKIVDISNKMVTARNEEEAKQIHGVLDFDRVPMENNDGNIKEYYDSNEDKTVQITPADLISGSSGSLETLSYLSEKHFYFILTGNNITHIVHYSDLNSPLVSLEIYSQIAYCEKAIRDYAIFNNKYENDKNGIKEFLNKINKNLTGRKNICIEQAEGRFNNKQTDDVEINLLDELILFREISSSRSKGQTVKSTDLNLEDTIIGSYKNLRNDIMHSKLIIKGHNDKINELIEFLKTCQEITLYIETMLNDTT